MEKKQKVIQVYGIIVCIIAIVTFVICISNFVEALIDRSDPLISVSRGNLSSLETYKVNTLKSVKEDQIYIPDDAALEKMYEAAKIDTIDKVLHNTKSKIIVNSLLMLISVVLFLFHWWMIKSFNKTEEIPIDASGGA